MSYGILPREVPLLRDQVVHAWRSPVGLAAARAAQMRTVGQAPPIAMVRDAEVAALVDAELFWVSADMAALWQAAAESMPPLAMTPADLPATRGFVVFEEPVVGIDATSGERIDVAGLAWTPARDWYTHQLFVEIRSFSDLYTRTDAVANPMRSVWPSRLFPIGHCAWTIPHTWTQPGAYEGRPQTLLDSVFEDRRRLAAFSELLAQRVALTARRPPNNAERKQAERRGGKPSDVTLITMRRGAVSPPAGERETHWSRRWVVSAHWRRQYYPSTRDHRWRIIAAYEKGPADKPLVVTPKVKVWTR